MGEEGPSAGDMDEKFLSDEVLVDMEMGSHLEMREPTMQASASAVASAWGKTWTTLFKNVTSR